MSSQLSKHESSQYIVTQKTEAVTGVKCLLILQKQKLGYVLAL